MAATVFLVLLTLALSHWLIEPLVLVAWPLLDLSWLGWAALLLLLWLFAAERTTGTGEQDPSEGDRPGSDGRWWFSRRRKH